MNISKKDVLSIEQRSFCMSRIKSAKTKPELIVGSILYSFDIPFKANYKDLCGRPDIYIPSLNLVIDIRGCFWHSHLGCKFFNLPKTNRLFWKKKLNDNVKRDLKTIAALKRMNIHVCVVWECEIKSGTFLKILLTSINSAAGIRKS